MKNKNKNHKKILVYLVRAILFLLLFVFFVWALFNWPVRTKNNSMKFGLSFSNIFARDIGLDWKKAYTDILDGLHPQKIRVASYWTEVEKQPGVYDFSDVDYQIEEAQKRNVDVVLAFGIKAPRWPECFIPDFYGGNPVNDKSMLKNIGPVEKEKREEALLDYEKALIARYKDYSAIKIWQVENEPFLRFGNCVPGAIDGTVIDKEIAQLKQLDNSRPVMVTDSGELSIWYQAAKRGNIFGTTMYRVIHKPPFGYVEYPLGPNFFRLKSLFIRLFAHQNNVIIAELQAEPWGPGWLPNLSLEEQYKSMDPKRFREIIEYARETNFSEAYLWGSEWWYWLKEKKGDDQMWNEARNLFNSTE